MKLALSLCLAATSVAAVASAAGPPPPASASGSTSLAQIARRTAATILNNPAAISSTRIGKPRYDHSGTHATVEITLDTGASVGVYIATFHRSGVLWRLRSVTRSRISCSFGLAAPIDQPDPPSIPAPPELPLS